MRHIANSQQPGADAMSGWLALALVYVLWGSLYAATKVAVESLPPLVSGGARFLLAALLLLAGIWWRRPDLLRMPGATVRRTWLAGTVLVGGSQLGIVLSLTILPSGLSALLMAAVPLWLTLLRLVAGERIGWLGLLGIAVGFAGVTTILAASSGIGIGDADPGTAVLGGLFALGGGVSHALGTWLTARAAPTRRPRSPVVTAALHALAGGVLLISVGVARGELVGFEVAAVSDRSWLALGYAFVAGSLVGYLSYLWALARLPVSVVGTYAYVNPVIAVAIGWVLLGESLSWQLALGGALVIAAVAGAVAAESRATSPKAVEPGGIDIAVVRRAVIRRRSMAGMSQRPGRRLRTARAGLARRTFALRPSLAVSKL